MPYNFTQIPDLGTVEELRQWLSEELKILSQSLNETTELELRGSKHAPDRPREGMIIHADGTSWDPGSGAGTYSYQGGVWVKINVGGGGFASTTEQLTGTEAAKSSTPDSVSALWEKGASVASAGTISLGEGGYFHITGTVTITDIDFAVAKDGRTAVLVFDGALTLTHNATTLILPGGANIVTAAGDVAIVTQDAGDNVKVTSYTRANGQAIVSSAQVVRQVLQTTNTANTDLTTAIPFDDTVPTSSEGTQVLSQAITPADNTNKVLCVVELWGQATGGDTVTLIAALFRGTTCISVVAHSVNVVITAPIVIVFLDSPASASAQTYSVRVGSDLDTATGLQKARLNGQVAGRKFGGASASTLTLLEIEA